jgi:2-keto-4-pentenoate hydratase/2-oxohepta-3-ene-1,7-dioic acid hydratase in catechol pathway
MRIARIRTADGPQSVVQDGGDWAVVADPFAAELALTGVRHPVAGARLLAPVQPTIVLGMAHNGSLADRELAPQAFQKSARTVVAPGEEIVVDPALGMVNVEGELAMVIGRTSRHLAPEQVPGAILGWTIGNDVTAVDQIPLDDKMTQAKNGDGFTPLGPWIETDLDPSDVSIDVEVNGEIVATSSTKLLAWNVVEQLVYLTSVLTLGPGDIVLTGSPATFAPVQPGDFARITLQGIGALTNPVAGPRPQVSAPVG